MAAGVGSPVPDSMNGDHTFKPVREGSVRGTQEFCQSMEDWAPLQ